MVSCHALAALAWHFADRLCLRLLLRDPQDKAVAFFDEALKNNENHEKSRLVSTRAIPLSPQPVTSALFCAGACATVPGQQQAGRVSGAVCHAHAVRPLEQGGLRRLPSVACSWLTSRACPVLVRLRAQEASMMLADVMFRKEEHDAATYHFQQVRHSRPHLACRRAHRSRCSLQLLEKNPTQYAALSKLIQLLRRAGRFAVRDVLLVAQFLRSTAD